ncbi:hypothetical protein LOAG_00626 [Loa loa]|uniref:Uncharacterized protein n=1 Tax=Loa loa TaxID=7209 RepID=A0A1S0UCU2_LOALO|nr:hypothetical protein LOAG_00626 [Loa loa]EFO27850.1 hypothetical protein LOAG_00626 [Loa loa]
MNGEGWEKRVREGGVYGGFQFIYLFSSTQLPCGFGEEKRRFHVQTAGGVMGKDFEWIKLDLIIYLISVGRGPRGPSFHMKRKPCPTSYNNLEDLGVASVLLSH